MCAANSPAGAGPVFRASVTRAHTDKTRIATQGRERAASILPFATDLLDLTAAREIRLTTSALFLSGICCCLAIFRHQRLDLAPIARTALELSQSGHENRPNVP
ncbi:MAG: hypothetical protein LLG97_11715 [Deltaproteobacteria bacterium]|nr:hypothetical protein [Deltaproteobacteria bacterium]